MTGSNQDGERNADATSTAHPRKLVWALSAAVVVALLVIAGLIGYLLADRDTSSPTADSSPSSSSSLAPPSKAAPTSIPKLEVVVRQFERENNAIRAGSPTLTEDTKALFQKYGVPACAAVISGFADAFGGLEAGDGAQVVKSVGQYGTRGKVVTYDERTGENSTTFWTYTGGEWRFTCEGLFDARSTATGTVDPIPTIEPYTAPPVTTSSEPAAGGSCSPYGATANGNTLFCANGGRWATVANPNVTVGAPCSTSGTQGLDTNGLGVRCSEGRWAPIP